MEIFEDLVPYMQDQPARRKRWAYLTEGIKSDSQRIMTEVLLDNQLREGMQRRRSMMLTEDLVTTADIPTFTTFALPIIRRVYPRLIATELMNVIPMNQPTGRAHYLDFKYAATQAGSPPTQERIDLAANFQAGYAAAAETTQVPKATLHLTSTTLEAETKKLAAQWSLEEEQDAMSQYGIDTGNEMSTVLGDEIARETDRTLLQRLFAFADPTNNVVWHSTVPGSGSFSLIDPKIYGATLYDALVDANATIKRKRYRSASWVVAGTTFCTRLEKLEQFRLFPAADPQGQIVTGPHLFGSIANRWTVYQDPWLDDILSSETALLGYKGTSAFDMAAVFAPYIGLMLTNPFTNPQDLTTVRAAMSRWAFKGLIPEAYATVTVEA